MAKQKDPNLKRPFSYGTFILGGLFTYFVFTPVIDGRFSLFLEQNFGKSINKNIATQKFINKEVRKAKKYRDNIFCKNYNKNFVFKNKRYYDQINYSRQLNPNNRAYWESRGFNRRPNNWEEILNSEGPGAWDNYSKQLNPNNNTYWRDRGYDERPDNWESELNNSSSKSAMDNRSNQMNPNNSAYLSSRSGGKGK